MVILGISRDSWHKRRHTGGKMKALRKKRKYELGRPPANTKVLYYFACIVMIALKIVRLMMLIMTSDCMMYHIIYDR